MLTDYLIRQFKHVIGVFLSTSDDHPDAVSSVQSVSNTSLNNHHRVICKWCALQIYCCYYYSRFLASAISTPCSIPKVVSGCGLDDDDDGPVSNDDARFLMSIAAFVAADDAVCIRVHHVVIVARSFWHMWSTFTTSASTVTVICQQTQPQIEKLTSNNVQPSITVGPTSTVLYGIQAED